MSWPSLFCSWPRAWFPLAGYSAASAAQPARLVVRRESQVLRLAQQIKVLKCGQATVVGAGHQSLGPRQQTQRGELPKHRGVDRRSGSGPAAGQSRASRLHALAGRAGDPRGDCPAPGTEGRATAGPDRARSVAGRTRRQKRAGRKGRRQTAPGPNCGTLSQGTIQLQRRGKPDHESRQRKLLRAELQRASRRGSGEPPDCGPGRQPGHQRQTGTGAPARVHSRRSGRDRGGAGGQRLLQPGGRAGNQTNRCGQETGTTVYAAVEKTGHHRSVANLEKQPEPEAPAPGASVAEVMRQRLRTSAGKALSELRQ
jgi:hypothetical protein